jgi:hypothetical protein
MLAREMEKLKVGLLGLTSEFQKDPKRAEVREGKKEGKKEILLVIRKAPVRETKKGKKKEL